MSVGQGKVALVVGASSGFGLGIAEALLAEGVIVYTAARRLDPMKGLAAKGARLVQMDICNDASVEAGIARIVAESGRIDILLNNAGYGAYGAVETVPVEEVMRQFDVNIFGLARVNKAVLPVMRAQRAGRIIVTSSLASHLSVPGSGWYTATKMALKGLAETLRMELHRTGVKVIQIEPGAVQTGFESVAFDGLDQREIYADYDWAGEQLRGFLTETYAKAPGPGGTVKAMHHAALARFPRAVYRTTSQSRLLPIVRAVLGLRLSSAIVRRMATGR